MLQRKYSIRSHACNEAYFSPVNVPFSWEYKPGLSKVFAQRSKKENLKEITHQSVLSPPPPCSVQSVVDDKEEAPPPLILCAVQMKENHHNHHHHKGLDDPFLKAYQNCTKSPLKLSTTSVTTNSVTSGNKRGLNWSHITKCMHVLLCYSARHTHVN